MAPCQNCREGAFLIFQIKTGPKNLLKSKECLIGLPQAVVCSHLIRMVAKPDKRNL